MNEAKRKKNRLMIGLVKNKSALVGRNGVKMRVHGTREHLTHGCR